MQGGSCHFSVPSLQRLSLGLVVKARVLGTLEALHGVSLVYLSGSYPKLYFSLLPSQGDGTYFLGPEITAQ